MRYLYIVLLVAFSTACSLQQEVDIDLPEYEPELMVECYLLPGQPYALTLTESVGYFDQVQIQFVKRADVKIKYKGEDITLLPLAIPIDATLPGGLIDTNLLKILKPLTGDSLYLYAAFDVVPEDYDSSISLEVETQDGRKLTASTRIPRPVPIESMEYKFNDDSLAFVLTRWQDNPAEINFYRRILEKRRRRIREDENGVKDTTYDVREEQDFIIDDDIENGQIITIGTNFEYKLGDTLIATNYHITGEYYRFIETKDAAFIANLSPFGQPATVVSNIVGGIGIFTGLTVAQMELVVGE